MVYVVLKFYRWVKLLVYIRKIFYYFNFLYNLEFYLQHVLQLNYNVHVYTLVILPICEFQYNIYHCCVYCEKLLMMDRGTARNMYSFIQKINLVSSQRVGGRPVHRLREDLCTGLRP